MAVEDSREDYDAHMLDVQRLRDCIAGERAMQNGCSAYIRRPEGMTDADDYRDYTKMVPFFDATSRTVDGLTGMAFFKDPSIDLPDAMKPLADDMTLDGVSLPAFAEGVLDEVVSVGRVGIMVDFPPADPGVRSASDAERANRRPFARIYVFEAAFNWTSGTVRNSRQLTEVRLLERELIDAGEFERSLEERIRVLQLRGSDADGWVYTQRVFLKGDGTNGKKDEWLEDLSRAAMPLLPNGEPLDFIPFWFINPRDQTDALVKPPLLGLANVNISHFDTTAKLERVLSFIGAPQPYVIGMDSPGDGEDGLTIGSAEIWYIDNKDAKLDYLVCPPDGTGPLERRLATLEQQMALLGARMLSPDKKGVETAETAGIHRQGEVSVLGSCCDSTSAAISDALKVMALWAGTAPPQPKCFVIDKGFFENAMTGGDAVSIMQLWQGGAIGFTDMIAKLKDGQIVGKDRSADDVQAEVQSGAQAPGISGLTGNPAQPPAKRPILKLNNGG